MPAYNNPARKSRCVCDFDSYGKAKNSSGVQKTLPDKFPCQNGGKTGMSVVFFIYLIFVNNMVLINVVHWVSGYY